MSKFNNCLRNGHISLGDDFDTVAEVIHLFGGTAAKLPYHNWFKVPNHADTIACLLSEDGGSGWHNIPEYGPNSDARGWNEILTVFEYNDAAVVTAQRIEEELAHPLTHDVFWHESRDGALWYKFQGVFTVDADATRATLDTEQPRVIYRRIRASAPCLKVKEVKQAFTDDELGCLKGRLVRINFLDEIGFSADCGETVKGEVRAWPGTKLLVTGVAPGCVHVTCDTQDQNLMQAAQQRIPAKARKGFRKVLGFTIPRQDFALGYVEVLPSGGTIEDTFAALSAGCEEN